MEIKTTRLQIPLKKITLQQRAQNPSFKKRLIELLIDSSLKVSFRGNLYSLEPKFVLDVCCRLFSNNFIKIQLLLHIQLFKYSYTTCKIKINCLSMFTCIVFKP